MYYIVFTVKMEPITLKVHIIYQTRWNLTARSRK